MDLGSIKRNAKGKWVYVARMLVDIAYRHTPTSDATELLYPVSSSTPIINPPCNEEFLLGCSDYETISMCQEDQRRWRTTVTGNTLHTFYAGCLIFQACYVKKTMKLKMNHVLLIGMFCTYNICQHNSRCNFSSVQSLIRLVHMSQNNAINILCLY